jgi:hypothetical protein
MVQIIDVTDEAEGVPVPEAAPAVTDPGKPSRAQSVLDSIRSKADRARENLTMEIPLPSTVPGPIALRVGVPTEAAETTLLVQSGSGNVNSDLADLAAGVVGISALERGEWEPVDGLDVRTLAVAFAEQLYGADRSAAITSDVDAIRELFSAGTPPTVNAQAVRSAAAVYRRWSADPLSFRTDDPQESE